MKKNQHENIQYHFDFLDKLLQEEVYRSADARETLIKLITHPKSALSVLENECFADFQAYLLDQDLEVQKITYLAISLAILRADYIGNTIADNIREVINKGKADLSLYNADLLRLDAARWQALFTALSASKITSLNLKFNSLNQLDAARWQLLCTALSASKITSLDLGGNDLNELDATRWQALCTALSTSKITSLNLEYNFFNQLDAARWQALFAALNASKITSLDLSDNGLDQLDAARWQMLVTSMEDNFHLQLKGLDDLPLDSPLMVIIKRNCFLNEVCQRAQELNELKSNQVEFLADIDQALQGLLNALALLQDRDTDNAQAIRSQLHTYIGNLNWKKAAWFRDQGDLNPAIAAWRAIAPQSSLYENANMEVFQLVYANARDYDNRNHGAFIAALPCLLNDQGTLITLKEDNQKVFDGFLFEAAAGRGFGKTFTPSERLAWLQYVILLKVKEMCETKAPPPNSHFFGNERFAGVKDLLKNLPVNPDNLAGEMQKIHNLWQEASHRLERLPVEDSTKALINAVSQLANSNQSLLPTWTK